MARHNGEEIVDRSGLRYAVMACVIAGGLLAAGSGGATAFADPSGTSSGRGSGHDSTSRSTGESAGTHAEGSGAVTGHTRGGYTSAPKNRRPWEHNRGKPGDGKPGDGKPGDGRGDGGRPDDPCDHDGNPGPGQPPPGDTGGDLSGSDGPPAGPSVKVPHVPPLQATPPSEPNAVEITAGPVEAAVAGTPPVLTAPVAGLSVPVAEGAGAAPPQMALPESAPSVPPETFREARAREPVPARVGGTTGLSSSYRVGYSEFLRMAGVWQMAALALPGVAGILLLTAGGGFIGYRQAKAGHAVRMEGIARFLQ